MFAESIRTFMETSIFLAFFHFVVFMNFNESIYYFWFFHWLVTYIPSAVVGIAWHSTLGRVGSSSQPSAQFADSTTTSYFRYAAYLALTFIVKMIKQKCTYSFTRLWMFQCARRHLAQ